MINEIPGVSKWMHLTKMIKIVSSMQAYKFYTSAFTK